MKKKKMSPLAGGIILLCVGIYFTLTGLVSSMKTNDSVFALFQMTCGIIIVGIAVYQVIRTNKK